MIERNTRNVNLQWNSTAKLMPKLGYPIKMSDKKTKHFWRLADGAAPAAPADDDGGEGSSSIIRMMMLMMMLRRWIAGNGNETGNARRRRERRVENWGTMAGTAKRHLSVTCAVVLNILWIVNYDHEPETPWVRERWKEIVPLRPCLQQTWLGQHVLFICCYCQQPDGCSFVRHQACHHMAIAPFPVGVVKVWILPQKFCAAIWKLRICS